jgi:hypothetical protein
MLRSPVIPWPSRLYMNGELADVQSEGLDLKWSILWFYNTCLHLDIFAVRCIIGMDWSLKYGGILDLTDQWWRILPKLMVPRHLLANDRFRKESVYISSFLMPTGLKTLWPLSHIIIHILNKLQSFSMALCMFVSVDCFRDVCNMSDHVQK